MSREPISALVADDLHLYGAIEGGGTKFMCAVVDSTLRIRSERRIPTTGPDETLGNCVAFFQESQRTLGLLRSFGVASFGPLNLIRGSLGWGSLLSTPKVIWSGASLVKPFADAFGRPIAIDTDVNAAAMAEMQAAAGSGLRTLTYITVGTGIGGGAIVNGSPLVGMPHPEMGHLRVMRHPEDTFPGICPFHGDCLEGMASGSAIHARWGATLSGTGSGGSALQIIGDYLGQLAAAVVLMLSSERIVFGGGVMRTAGLLPAILDRAKQLLGDYPIASDLHRRIGAPALGERSGILGAAQLAMAANPTASA